MKYSIRLCLACLALLSTAAAQRITSSQSTRLRYNPFISTSSSMHKPASPVAGSVSHQISGNGLCQPQIRAEYAFRNEDGRKLQAPGRSFDFVLRHRLTMPVAGASTVAQEDCPIDKHGCHACVEHWDDDDDKCADNPGLIRRPADYNPGPGESCWVLTRCWCNEGQYPSNESCSPCRYGGQEAVCMSR
jgi:hypothetical protein